VLFKPGHPTQPGGLKLQTHLSGGHGSLCVDGEVDLASAGRLEAAIRRLMHDATEILVDLEQVSFMDSTGLNALLRAQQLCHREQTGFAITPGPEQVRRLFNLAGLAGSFALVTPRWQPAL
jgi:anti-anti-sigma factor